jgi:thiol-disulfide isomerase/thioredoxin
MPAWIKSALYLIMLLCCVIIGARVYLEFQSGTEAAPAALLTGKAPEQLPEFTLNDIWDEPHTISEWSGKPLLINFWATWCAPCRREMPLLQTLHNERVVTGLQIVGIAIDRQPDVQSYIAEAGISYPILSGEADAMAVSELFGLDGLGLPFSVLVAGNGTILTVHLGEVVRQQLADMVTISKAFEAGELDIDQARQQLAEL